MDVSEAVESIIVREINSLNEDDLGKAKIDDVIMDVPELSILLEPESDVGDIESMHRLAHNPSVLGVYFPMRSPGVIHLFSHKIRNFLGSLIRSISPKIGYITKFDLIAGARIITKGKYIIMRYSTFIAMYSESFGGGQTLHAIQRKPSQSLIRDSK